MWADFHEYVTDDILCTGLTQIIQEITPVNKEVSQCFLAELVDSIFKPFCQQIEKNQKAKMNLVRKKMKLYFTFVDF